MDYSFKPSLVHIACVKLSVILWNQPDIVSSVRGYNFSFNVLRRKREWDRIENKVIAEVTLLPLPGYLKDKISYYIKPIGLQILKWMAYHKNYGLYFPAELHWTPQGTLDKKKTAEVLVKDNSLSVVNRYKLSCIYCLKDDSLELWNKMAENDKQSFYNETDPIFVKQKVLIVLWTYYIKGELSKMSSRIEKILNRSCSPFLFGMEESLKYGNEVAVEYYMEKMSSIEKEEALVKNANSIARNITGYVSDSLIENEMDILNFLLAHMSKEQQIVMIEKHPFRILNCLLNWPWQSIFMEAAKHSWVSLIEECFFNILKRITQRVIDGYKDWNYKKLFQDFWSQSHDHHKIYIIGECSRFFEIMINLLKTKDKDNIRLMFKYASATIKNNFIFSDYGSYISRHLIDHDDWHLLEFFLKECTSSKDDLTTFKCKFVDWGYKERIEVSPHKMDKFFSLVDNIVSMCEDEKRRCEDECDNVPAKKVHRM